MVSTINCQYLHTVAERTFHIPNHVSGLYRCLSCCLVHQITHAGIQVVKYGAACKYVALVDCQHLAIKVRKDIFITLRGTEYRDSSLALAVKSCS